MTLLLSELIEKRRKLPPIDRNSVRSTLAERFLLPPFTILDARQGYWQKRKRAWLGLGIQSELGRSDTPSTRYSDQAVSHYKASKSNSFNSGKPGTLGKRFDGADNSKEIIQGGTSIFDPVLCELLYRWFTPKGGHILDPFAGGSVRGIVAGKLRRSYIGIDLRQEQVEANRVQANEICPDVEVLWSVGDSYNVCDLSPGRYDFIFSCPPYADLERYSDDPRDLSTMDYEKFLTKYKSIIKSSCSMLSNNRFACFVVANVRDRITGNYRDLVGETISAFREAGLHLYNEAILVTSVGSLPIRVGSMFKSSRKLGKSHQNVLIFLKGDAELACLECGEVDMDDLNMPECHIGKLAVCEQDVRETNMVIFLADLEDGSTDVKIINLDLVEACLLCDVARSYAVSKSEAIPRMWIGTVDGWKRLEDLVELTYVVNGVAYLNREVFPDASVPAIDRLPVRTLRRGGNGA